jgi:PIN domain nuclease of toxin-antitoxin system
VSAATPAGAKTLALDSSAVLRWVLQEQRWQVVERLIKSDLVDLVLPGPVLTEVINRAHAKGNVSTSSGLQLALSAAGMRVEPPTAVDLQVAGELLITSRANIEHRGGKDYCLSLGDSLVLAVAFRLGCPVVTSDRHWSWLAGQGLISVQVHQI